MMTHWSFWLWLSLLGLVITSVVVLWRWSRHRPSLDARLNADADDPYRQWVQNVFLLVTGDCDYAHLRGSEARRILAHWWKVFGPIEHRRTLDRLARRRTTDNAWDLVRYIIVSRLGVAAGIIPDEVSWAEILPIARRLQRAYPFWRAMAQAYARARRQSRGLPMDGSADDDSMRQLLDNLAHLDDTRWQAMNFKMELRLVHSQGNTDV